jgi:hypothetical protein
MVDTGIIVHMLMWWELKPKRKYILFQELSKAKDEGRNTRVTPFLCPPIYGLPLARSQLT